MKQKLLLIVFMIFTLSVHSQTENATATDVSKIMNASELEIKPEFPGGISSFYQFVAKNFQVPTEDISGKIYITFIVEVDGKLSNINVTRGINPIINQEAIRVMRLSPNWIPGKIGNDAVRVKYNLPLNINNR